MPRACRRSGRRLGPAALPLPPPPPLLLLLLLLGLLDYTLQFDFSKTNFEAAFQGGQRGAAPL